MTRKITVNPKFEGIREFVESIPGIFETRGETIYNKRNQIKVMTAPDGTKVNVKRYQVPHGSRKGNVRISIPNGCWPKESTLRSR